MRKQCRASTGLFHSMHYSTIRNIVTCHSMTLERSVDRDTDRNNVFCDIKAI